MSNCADCAKRSCRSHDLDNVPSNCPCLAATEEEVMNLYSDEERRQAAIAAVVEAESWKERNTRVEDTMAYAARCGYRKLGLAFCTGLADEARTLARILRKNGFEVFSAICKNGSVPKEKLGIDEEDKLQPGCFEAMCNPVGQAKLLDAAGCEMNIVLGLCVGHDTLFFKHSQAPVTVLATKDRALGHNALAALYTADSYYERQYTFLRDKEEE